MFACKKVLITAGPTYEAIDPVRFIGNRSSGKMGYAIAESFARRNIEVILVSGPVALELKHPLLTIINVESAKEMYEVCKTHFPHCQGAILSAAVADFTPETVSSSKIKKGNEDHLTIRLIKTKDILACLGQIKSPAQKLVGFSLESDNEIENATGKLHKKNLDFIVLNSLRDAGVAFGSDNNKISIINKEGHIISYPLKPKKEVAEDIVNAFLALFNDKKEV